MSVRLRAVAMARRGPSLRRVARRFGVSLSTVQRWIARAGPGRLDRAALDDRPPGRAANRTGPAIEDRVLAARKRLAERSDLGEHGAEAIHRELVRAKVKAVPSARTIGRILLRRGGTEKGSGGTEKGSGVDEIDKFAGLRAGRCHGVHGFRAAACGTTWLTAEWGGGGCSTTTSLT